VGKGTENNAENKMTKMRFASSRVLLVAELLLLVFSCACAQSAANVSGVCGSANGKPVLSAPTTNLCSSGTPTTVSGSGPWNWSCNGSDGGSNANCSAPGRNQAIESSLCGPANSAIASTKPTSNLCASRATSSTVVGASIGPWSWTCTNASSPSGTVVAIATSADLNTASGTYTSPTQTQPY